MFRVARKKVSAGDLARDYIWQTFKSADRTLDEYAESLMQIFLRNGLSQEDFGILFEKEKLRNIYFTGLLAMGIVDLRNSMEGKTAVKIGEKLQQLLRFPSGVGTRSAAALVADYLREVEAKASDMPAHEAIALRMMSHIGVSSGEQARALFRNPLCVTALSRQLAAVGTGWWSSVIEQVKVAA